MHILADECFVQTGARPEVVTPQAFRRLDCARPGTYLDMTANLPIVDPARVTAPVLIVRGEHDGIATEEDRLEFYRRLPNPDRQFVILAARPTRLRSVTLAISSGT
jgi:pimeloyl-ACP methyl ester carboxylesterase